ncbi:MAG: tRNA (adenosine(37)-N6)-dimethylallyltransferase MiaA [Pirellulales bacterium]|nr:tRNA (adenosine(37)-N6)-dimethylallyltransferase MiaA [Pirellulales bacterium]
MQNETEKSFEPDPNHRCFDPVADEVIVLTGATASGKSQIAIGLAERLGGEILSLDSIAVYRGMDIGTAKPAPHQRRGVPHHLIDLVDPVEEFSVARYLQAAHQRIAEVTGRGRRVIFVGGTPMFLKGVLRGFDPGPPADWQFREAVEADVERHGVEALRRRLRQVDPLAAHRIGPNDTRRMIRALEVARLTGIPLSHRQTQFEQGRDAATCNVYSLLWPRDQLHQRINQRVSKMFEEGLVDEVRALLSRFGSLSRTASQAVGYREVLDWLDEGGDLQKTFDLVSAHTRQLARRQETWFRSFSEIQTVEVGQPIATDAVVERIMGMIAAKEN